MIWINSQHKHHWDLQLPAYADEQIKNEPMLFNCDLHHAYEMGGPITRAFLELLPDDWKEGPLVVDSRVHMLMPGWHPCIPGWHHDDVPRSRSDGQPDYDSPLRSRHIMAVVNADLCPTEIAHGTDHFEDVPIGTVVYKQWHREVEQKLRAGSHLTLDRVRDRVLLEFDDRTWHQGTAAVGTGWRFFVRASRYENAERRIDRGNPRTNETRKQVQVYMNNPHAGW